MELHLPATYNNTPGSPPLARDGNDLLGLCFELGLLAFYGCGVSMARTGLKVRSAYRQA
jgi:hypothetical protein